MDQAEIRRRLAFVKYLDFTAGERADAPEPFSSVSLLLYHDAAELFLLLAAEEHNVGKKGLQFMQYFDLLEKVAGTRLHEEEGMRRLNNARNSLKHHGNLPSAQNLRSFRGIASAFFEQNAPLLFQLSYASVSLIDLLSDKNVRETLDEAEKARSTGDAAGAVTKAAIAFQQLLDGYERTKSDDFGRSPFRVGERLTWVGSGLLSGRGPRQPLPDGYQKVVKSVESLQETVKILMLGVDYRRYARFTMLTPLMNKFGSGGENDQYETYDEPGSAVPTDEHAEFCISFVVEVGLHLADFDFALGD